MELADRNLLGPLPRVPQPGLPGIPRDELLRYLDEAAEALDLMNEEHNLQHLDVKPQNLFLVPTTSRSPTSGWSRSFEGIAARR